LTASKLEISFKNIKTSNLIKTGLIMAPIIYNGHIFVIHFLG
jgi:hypothetical protein